MQLGECDWTVEISVAAMDNVILQTAAGIVTLAISVLLYFRLVFRNRKSTNNLEFSFLHPNW